VSLALAVWLFARERESQAPGPRKQRRIIEFGSWRLIHLNERGQGRVNKNCDKSIDHASIENLGKLAIEYAGALVTKRYVTTGLSLEKFRQSPS